MNTSRRATFLARAATALCLSFAIAPSVVATSTSAPKAVAATRTFTYDVVTSPFHLVDTGDRGPSIGDQTVFDDTLYLAGRVVGSDSGSCVITRVAPKEANPFRVSCVATYVVPGGTIAAQGVMTNAPTKILAIVGGTGQFDGARGRITFVEFGNGKGRVTIELTK